MRNSVWQFASDSIRCHKWSNGHFFGHSQFSSIFWQNLAETRTSHWALVNCHFFTGIEHFFKFFCNFCLALKGWHNYSLFKCWSLIRVDMWLCSFVLLKMLRGSKEISFLGSVGGNFGRIDSQSICFLTFSGKKSTFEKHFSSSPSDRSFIT